MANHFRNLWGKEAGWAHSVLFVADLKSFSNRLTAKDEINRITLNVDLDTTRGLASLNRSKSVNASGVKREFEDITPAILTKGDVPKTEFKKWKIS